MKNNLVHPVTTRIPNFKPGCNGVHFVGIGGIGISALARYFLSEGWKITGSDLVNSENINELRKEGAKIYIGRHRKSNVSKNIQLLVYNQAISPDNPELSQARNFCIQCESYPQALGKLTKKYKTIAIAGSHGKSNTTALTALILIEAGLDPTVIVGTKLKEFGNKNFRKGKSEWLVIEADEWRASFLNYSPALAVVTNIDKEHLDFYKNFAGVKKTFDIFKKRCGKVLAAPTNVKLKSAIKKILKIPGRHNVENALLAYAIGKELKIPREIIFKALGKYEGAWRRMEYRGIFKAFSDQRLAFSRKSNQKLLIPKPYALNASVYDDYAHHPTEIRATLAAFKEKHPRSFLICVFQPHQAARLKALFKEFKGAFQKADATILLPTYEVAGRDQKSDQQHDSRALAKAIKAVYVKNPRENLKRVLGKTLIAPPRPQSPAIIVMMGAGNIAEYTKLLI